MTEFKWDGSFLGTYKTTCILDKKKVADRKVWTLDLKEGKLVTNVRKVESRFPAVIDELKPVFGLAKIGTHVIMIGKCTYLLSKPYYVNGEMNTEVSLTAFETKSVIFRQQIQDVFAFRELMGLTTNLEKYVLVRKPEKTLPYPISYFDISSSLEKEKSTMSKKIIEKWFDDTDKLKVKIERLVTTDPDKVDDQDYIINVLAEYRTKIENVINRVDKECIWMSVYIIERLQKALSRDKTVVKT